MSNRMEIVGRRSRLGLLAMGLRGLMFALVAAASLWLGGFLQFMADLPRQAENTDEPTDAIVVLTGGANRLQVGFELLAEGKAKRLLISGVSARTSRDELRPSEPRLVELFACCVELGHQALDTRGNATEAALWIRQHGFSSLRLVTASYHMPRSLLLFRQAMAGISVLPSPVLSAHVKIDEWWLFPGSAKLLAMEFSKYVVSLVAVRFTGPAPA